MPLWQLLGRNVKLDTHAIVTTSTEVREILFYEDQLLVAMVEQTPYVALKPIAGFLGLDWGAQYRRTLRTAQAAEISNKVKALAELLTRTDASKNHYQGIFSELYRRFSVSSYKLIRQDQYQEVLRFLDDWSKAL